jgi:hypothetical protein
MLGNLAEALLALCMVAIGPALLALIVVTARSLAKAQGARLQPAGGNQAVVATDAARQVPAGIAVIVSVLAGAAGAFISLEAYYVGVALTLAGGWLMLRQASRQRWFALGGFLLGMGACAAGLLSPVLTNHDPAVSYDPSTIPTFLASVFIGLCGVAILVVASLRRRTAEDR